VLPLSSVLRLMLPVVSVTCPVAVVRVSVTVWFEAV
jgi:hypothetical protein